MLRRRRIAAAYCREWAALMTKRAPTRFGRTRFSRKAVCWLGKVRSTESGVAGTLLTVTDFGEARECGPEPRRGRAVIAQGAALGTRAEQNIDSPEGAR